VTPPPSLQVDRRLRWAAAAIVVLALALRVAVVVGTPAYTPQTDDRDFDRVALSIAHGDGYPPSVLTADRGPSAFRPPGFAVLLGGAYAVTGVPGERTRWDLARGAEAVLGTVAVALTGVLALLLFGAVPGLLALGLAAAYPPLLIPSASLLSESLFIPLVLGAVVAALLYRRAPARLRWVAAAGLLAGLATLTRSNGLLLLLPLLLGVVRAAREASGSGETVGPGQAHRLAGGSVRAATVLLAAFIVVVAPWTIRNAVALKAFVPVTTQGGFGLAGTYNADSRDRPIIPAAWRPPNLVPELAGIIRQPGRSEADVSRTLRQRSVAFIRSDPDYLVEVCYWNVRRLATLADAVNLERILWRDYGVGPRLSDAGVLGFWLVALLAAGGLLTRAARRAVRRVPLFVWSVPLVLVAPAVPIAGNMRYRIPADPFLILLAAIALSAAAGWILSRRAPA